MTKLKENNMFFNYGKYKLAYKIYGHPTGFPIFVNYGLIGTVVVNELVKMASNKNIKLYILERPGYGTSDFINMKHVLEWTNIVEQFFSYLKIVEFGTIGISAGAPYAYSLAYQFPERIKGLYILSGIPNILDPTVYAQYPSSHKEAYERYKKASLQEIAEETTKVLTKLKYKLFFSKKWRAGINAGLANNCMGVASVIKQQVTDWGFDVYSIKRTIHLWHSQKDTQVPFLAVEKMIGKMQHVEFHIQKESSHFPSKKTVYEMFDLIKKLKRRDEE